MIIDPRSVPAAICQGRPALRRGRKRNGLNFKRLGKVRVIIFENMFAIVVPVDLSSYVFGRWCSENIQNPLATSDFR